MTRLREPSITDPSAIDSAVHVDVSVADVVRAATEQGLLSRDVTVVGFIDIAGVRRSVAQLEDAFSLAPAVQHSFAAKANPLVPVLRLLRDCGMSCEVASPGELAVALAAGFEPRRIVLDSPAKTEQELRFALGHGVAINLDNLQELAIVDALRRELPSESIIGLRINPQVGTGSIGYMSTAGADSKFGVALLDPGARAAVVAAFTARPWLTRLHAHVGSQGCPLELIAEGIAAVHELADEINSTVGRQQVTSLDIGGGLPVNFDDDEIRPTFAEYASELSKRIPTIFDGRYELVTEFGRSLLAKNGFMTARVEYTKDSGGTRIALTHVGAQVATRTVFMPAAWPVRVSAYDANGIAKIGAARPHDIAGPLCFAGDLIGRGVVLPELEPGDQLVVHDTGAYYFTSPWTYNSLPSPAVYGYAADETGRVRFTLIKAAQTLDEIVLANGGAQVDALLG